MEGGFDGWSSLLPVSAQPSPLSCVKNFPKDALPRPAAPCPALPRPDLGQVAYPSGCSRPDSHQARACWPAAADHRMTSFADQ